MRGSFSPPSHWPAGALFGLRDPAVFELGEGGRGAWGHLFRLPLKLANSWGVFGSEEEEVAAGADLDAISGHGSEAPPVPVQPFHRGRVLLH